MASYPAAVTRLIALLRDGEKGFLVLSERVHELHCRSYMLEEAFTRAAYAQELERLLAAGETEHTTGTTLGMLHRAWLELTAEFGAADDALVEALHSCETVAIKAYELALLDASLPAVLHEAVAAQSAHIQQTLPLIRHLCKERLAPR